MISSSFKICLVTYLCFHLFKSFCHCLHLLSERSQADSSNTSTETSPERRQTPIGAEGSAVDDGQPHDTDDDLQGKVKSACDVSAEAEGVLRQLEASRGTALIAQTMQELTKVAVMSHERCSCF